MRHDSVEDSFRSRVRNTRIERIRPVISPALLLEQLPLSVEVEESIVQARKTISRIISGRDKRLMVVVGPCSIHDVEAALEYANLLREEQQKYQNELFPVMRAYFEKPRTTVGWKGLINDPGHDGTFDINLGLRVARKLLLDIVGLGLPTATEFLDPITPQYIADVVAWGAIGARTSESQPHRELSSGLSMPIGFKNGTRGSVQIAIDGVLAAAHKHHFLSVTEQGITGFVSTLGNKDCHVILRGSSRGPNFSRDSVSDVYDRLGAAGLRACAMIDCSHGNAGKDHERQPIVVSEVSAQIAEGDDGIIGLMLESNLKEGSQKLTSGTQLVYGQSITDGCMGWKTTVDVLSVVAEAVKVRRRRGGSRKA
jgi:3-deoxy-7-phosphoheptulonate synthase